MLSMSNESQWKFDKSGHDKAGERFLSYQDNEKNWTKTFHFRGDICTSIVLMMPNDQLSGVIKDMNSRLFLNGDNFWYDDKEKIQYAIIPTDNRNFFEIYQWPQSSPTLSK